MEVYSGYVLIWDVLVSLYLEMNAGHYKCFLFTVGAHFYLLNTGDFFVLLTCFMLFCNSIKVYFLLIS